MKYHFILKKKGCKYYAKGIDINYYYQANTKSELLDNLPYYLQVHLKRNFDGTYDPDIFIDWVPEERNFTILTVRIPVDFAFGLILKDIRKNYPGGKEKLMRDLGIEYDSFESFYFVPLKNLDNAVRSICFPHEWLFD